MMLGMLNVRFLHNKWHGYIFLREPYLELYAIVEDKEALVNFCLEGKKVGPTLGILGLFVISMTGS